MKKLNVVAVYSNDGQKLLMCKRLKDPYKGKFNLVGGKLESNEKLEYLGDSILEFITSKYLYNNYKNLKELNINKKISKNTFNHNCYKTCG